MTSSRPLPFSSLAMWLTEGNSFRQSGHQVAQKNSITTFPRRSERLDLLTVEVGQRESGRGFEWFVGNRLHRREIGGRERGRSEERHGHAKHQRHLHTHHAAPESLRAFSTSSALSRLSGLSIT